MILTETYQYYRQTLAHILSAERFEHSLRVVDAALELGKHFKLSQEQIALAALVHDRGKEIEDKEMLELAEEYELLKDRAEVYSPSLLHGPVGAQLLRLEGHISDEGILKAVHYHTTGRPDMSDLEKVIFMADLIEPGRDYPNVDVLRTLAHKDIGLAVEKALDWTLEYLMRCGCVIHPLTVQTRNDYLMKQPEGVADDPYA